MLHKRLFFCVSGKRSHHGRVVIGLILGLLLTLIPGGAQAGGRPGEITGLNATPAITSPPAPLTSLDPQQGPPPKNPPVTFLTGPASGDPLDIALAYLRRHKDRLGLTDQDLANLVVKDRYVSSSTQITHLYLRQQLNGIEVFNGDININISGDGRVINLGNQFVPHLEQATSASNNVITAGEAVERAAQHLGLTVTESLLPRKAPQGPAKEGLLSGSGISQDDIPVKLMYMPQPGGEVRLVWNLVLRLENDEDWWNFNVDAVSGAILLQNDWIAHAGGGSYRVYALPGENPDDVSRTQVNDPADPLGSPWGWHDTDGLAGPEFTITRGNNVHAYADANGDNVSDLNEPNGGDGLVFNTPVNLSQPPAAYRDAAVINLFYWNNLLHDVFYRYGFNEASGNFQQNNYGRGGSSNDSVQAEAQDGSGINNANFGTPPDGSRPRMQMYLFNATSPSRDGDFDNLIITHEYGHGVSNRLTGGPGNVNCLVNAQSRGMGEGWSDFFGLVFTAKSTDLATGRYPVGTYVLGQSSSGAGIRNFPYSRDLNVDPQTYASIATTNQPHGVGEVWAMTLWEMYWNLVNAYGFNTDLYNLNNGNGGNNRALQLVIDGLKLQPCNPSFLDARDAILLADQARYAGANQCLIWDAFAKRGMGVNANDGGSSNSVIVTQNFEKPAACQVANLVLQMSANPPTALVGQELTYTLVAGNNTTAPLNGVVMTSDIPANTTYVPGSASSGGTLNGGILTWNIGTIAANSTLNRTFKVLVDADLDVTAHPLLTTHAAISANGGVTANATLETPVAVSPIGQCGVEEVATTLFREDFETGALNGWVVDGPNSTWVASNSRRHSGTFAAYGEALDMVSDQRLRSPGISLPAGQRNYTLKYWNYQAIEANGIANCYDGAILEVSPNGGASWTQLTPQLITDPYDGTIAADYGNPLGNKKGWCGDPEDWHQSVVDLNAFAGQTLQFRFRLGTDESIGREGWTIDDVEVLACAPAPARQSLYIPVIQRSN